MSYVAWRSAQTSCHEASGMMDEPLVRVVDALSSLLRDHAHCDLAERLDSRLAVLMAARQGTEEWEEACAGLHGTVLGMGGLFDLVLADGPTMPAASANEILDELADELFRLTRPTR